MLPAEFYCHVCNQQKFFIGADGAYEHLSLHLASIISTLARLTHRTVLEEISDDRDDD